jgi:hypothetical protein
MNDKQIKKLMTITAKLEHIVLNIEDKSMRDLEVELSTIYSNMVEFVGAEIMTRDEISGTLE